MTFIDDIADHVGIRVGESGLDDTKDPAELVHGDLDALATATDHLGNFASAFEDTAVGLSAVDTEHWTGAAAEAFRAKFQAHPEQWANAQKACASAADALENYSTTVQWAQDQARQAAELYGQSTDELNQQRAQRILDSARQKRDAAAQQAITAISAATELAPTEPSFGRRLLNNLDDIGTGTSIADAHMVGGFVKGTGDLVKFGRAVDPLDPYNLTHPAEFVGGVSTIAAGVVRMSNHPDELVTGLAGTGWTTDPAEAAGKLIPNIVLGAATDGGGTAAETALSSAERVAVDAGETAERSAVRDAAGEAADSARTPEEMTCAGDPIDVATGNVVLKQTDVELAGVLPLVFERTHVSAYRAGNWFGPTWASTVDQRLVVDGTGVLYTAPDGVILFYPRPTEGGTVLPAAGARWPLSDNGDDGYTILDPQSGRVLVFRRRIGDSWPLTAIVGRAGDVITFDHDAAGTPLEIHHEGGYRIRIETDRGRVTALHLGDVELIRYGYTEGRLTEVTDSSGLPLRLRYDSTGRIVEWLDRNDFWYRYGYDANGRCVRAEGTDGFLDASFDYDRENLVTTHTDGLGAVTRYQLDQKHHVVAVTDPLGRTKLTEVDGYGRPLSETDPLGRTTAYAYDEFGNITAVTLPDGSRTLAEYNDLCLPVTLVNTDGAVWRHQYDERGLHTAMIDPAGHITLYSHDENGHLVAATDTVGNTTVVENDAAGLPRLITDPAGNVIQYTRDAFGRIVEHLDPVGGITRYGWTMEGRPAWRTLPDGSTERWTHDAEGNPAEQVDPDGRATSISYTAFDLPAARTGPDGARLEFAYDNELRLVSVTNPQGLAWRYDYDLAGQLVQETDFNGRVLRYRYDACGQLVERTNGAGQVVSFDRDELGNVVARSCGGLVTRFGYDAAGRLVHAAGPDAELTLRRDVLGQVVAETVNGRTLTTGYDPLGRRVHRRTPDGAESSWRFDAVGNATTLHTAGRTIEFEHDQAGREVGRRMGASFRLAQHWNANHHLTSQLLVGGERHTHPLQRRAYHYWADGLLTGIDDQLTGSRRFELDAAGRITSVRSAQTTEAYSYDPAGNITHAGWSGAADTGVLGAREYNGTLVTTAGKIRYQHDQQGRLVLRQQKHLSTKDSIWRYSWDGEDRLVAVSTPDGTLWRYRYDPLGRRIAKQRMASDGVTVVEHTDFTWDGTTLVEQAHSGGQVTTWDWEPDGLRVVSQTDKQFYAIVTDLIGTPTELVDVNGNLAWHQPTTLWGAALARLGNRADTPLRFPGQYFDQETGLHYNYHRYYDPTTGRYASPDPLGLSPAPNPHTYVANPTSLIDPFGLAPCKPINPGRNGAFRQAKRDLGIPSGQQPDSVSKVTMTDKWGHSILGDDGLPIQTREYTFTREDGSKVIIQDHGAGHQFGEGGVGDQGPHFNVRPPGDPRSGTVPGTKSHYPFQR